VKGHQPPHAQNVHDGNLTWTEASDLAAEVERPIGLPSDPDTHAGRLERWLDDARAEVARWKARWTATVADADAARAEAAALRATAERLRAARDSWIRIATDFKAERDTARAALADTEPTPAPEREGEGRALCDGCNVREPYEHRCHGVPCPCEECREADRLFGHPAPTPDLRERVGKAALDAYEAIPYDNDLADEQVWAAIGDAILAVLAEGEADR
jgi:hypothetical protein